MGKKYIIELEDKPFRKEDGDFLHRVKGFNTLVFDMTGIGMLTPYTEPDLKKVRKETYKIGYEKGYRDGVNRIGDAEDKIRKEAFEEGKKQAKVQAELNVCHDIEKVAKANYQRGLSDAWEAARKIIRMPEADLLNLFTECYSAVCTSLQVFLKYDASECIEKIRQYEQEKQEKDAEIKVGKEFQMGERKCVVTHIIDGTQRRVLWDNGVSGLVDNTDLFVNLTPTGRTFPEIAAILKKMREGQDG